MLVIDPGHGGSDFGCHANGLVEKHLALSVGLALHALAQSVRLPVALTRERDEALTLSARGQRASALRPTHLVSLHFDANPDPAVGGVTCYCMPSDLISRTLAVAVGRVAPEALSPKQRPILVASNGWKARAFNVLAAHDGYPALLIECGYLTNTTHAKYLAAGGTTAVAASILAALVSKPSVREVLPSRV